jgi:diguanylate cyclase
MEGTLDPLLLRLADSLQSGRSLEEITRPLLEMLEAVTGLESTYLTTIDQDAGVQHILYARNSQQMQVPEGLSVPWDDTLCKRALDEGRTYTGDVASCWGDSEAARALGIQTYVSSPVRLEGGDLYGTLCAASARSVPLALDAEKILALFSRLIAQHVEHERVVAQLRKANAELAESAMMDAVTGLPNRRFMLRELERMLARARRDGSSVVVAFLDLDGFKAVNDTHGHDVGDQLLAAVGRRLAAGLRAADFVARIGGDEFVVLAAVPRATADFAAAAVRRGLAERMAGPFEFGAVHLPSCTASIGLAISGDGQASAQDLLREADQAMYEDKRQRRSQAGSRGAPTASSAP